MIRLASLICCIAMWNAHAIAQDVDAPPTFLTQEISPALVVQDAEVMDVVTTLLQRYDIPVRAMTDDIEGIVSGRLGDVSVSVFLNRLGALHGFYWYYDGSYVEVGPADDVSGETVKIAPTEADNFRADLAGMGMEFPQFPLNINATTGVVFMRGPESFRSIVRDLANQYQQSPPEETVAEAPARTLTVNVIHGRRLAVGDSPIVQSHSFPAPPASPAGLDED